MRPRNTVRLIILTLTSICRTSTRVASEMATRTCIARKPRQTAGMAKVNVWTVMRVTSDWFLSPRVLSTANSYFLSSTSVCMREKTRMKLSRQMKKITVTSTLFSMN